MRDNSAQYFYDLLSPRASSLRGVGRLGCRVQKCLERLCYFIATLAYLRFTGPSVDVETGEGLPAAGGDRQRRLERQHITPFQF
jgi:hypothetical protein